MRVFELYSHVARLGFEDSLEEDKDFFNAANRAIMQVGAIRPAIRTYTVNHRPLENAVKEKTFYPVRKNGELTFEAVDVKAYYFEADGIGQAYIERYDDESGEWDVIGNVPLTSSGVFEAHSGFIKDGEDFVSGIIRVRFTGEYIYSVRFVAMYRDIYSEDAEDIPAYQPWMRYNLQNAVEDFLSLESPPITDGEKRLRIGRDYDVENGRILLLPYEKPGVYEVQYRHRPVPISDDTEATENESVIDLDEDLCDILPMLIAAYVWADDEPQKAEYYLSLYREAAAEIAARDRNREPVKFRSLNGW